MEFLTNILPFLTLIAGWAGNLFYARIRKRQEENNVSKDEFSSFRTVSEDYMKNLKELIDEVTMLHDIALELRKNNSDMNFQLAERTAEIERMNQETNRFVEEIEDKNKKLGLLQKSIDKFKNELQWMKQNCSCEED